MSPLDQRVMESAIGALEMFGIYLGDRLGLYAAIRSAGPLTAAELAERAGIHERYAREWLEQQAVAGVLAVDSADLPADQRRYRLPEEHAGVVADPTSADYLAAFGRLVVGVARVLDDVAAAYRTGAGVPYALYGEDFRSGQAAINRPAFTTALVHEWLPAVPDLMDRLKAGGRVADLGCGLGWSTIAVARAFPTADVWGFDLDQASIEDARRLSAEQGSPARFVAEDAASISARGPFDLVMILEALHDMARPVDALTAARSALAPGGSVLIADEAVAPEFVAPGDEIERMMYGWSITACLPNALAEQPSAAIGTVIREKTIRTLAADAGFGAVDVLPVDAGFFRLYHLRPS